MTGLASGSIFLLALKAWGAAQDPILDGPVWSIEGEGAGAELGSVSSTGDVNGDGFDDVIVG